MSFTTSGRKRLPLTHPLSLKLQSLNELNNTIRQLETSLKTLRATRDTLEGEIAAFRATNATIKRIPVEILILIFKDAIKIKGTSDIRIRDAYKCRLNLMLTCRQWRQVVNGTPSLWSTIYINAPELWHSSIFVWAKEQHHYLDLALARSGDVALDVIIRLEKVLDGSVYVHNRILGGLIGSSEGEKLDEWMAGMPWDECPVAGAYDDVVVELLFKAIGERRGIAARWSSLYFAFPESWGTRSIFWLLFDWPLPQLRTLEIEGSSVSLPQSSEEVVSLTSLQTLVTGSFSLEFLPACPSLQSITISMDPSEYDWKTFHLISQFPTLQKITIIGIEGEDYEEPRTMEEVQISSLDHLSLIGIIPSFVVKAFDIKKLKRLTLEESEYASGGITQARVFSVAKHLVYSELYSRSNSASKKLLSALLSQATTVRVLEVKSRRLEPALEVVASCRKRGHLKSLASVITFSDVEAGQGRKLVYDIPLGKKIDLQNIIANCLRFEV